MILHIKNEATLIDEALAAAVSLFGLAKPTISRLQGGRVNESFLVSSGGACYVLQQISCLFQGRSRLSAPLADLPQPETTVGDNWQAVCQAFSARSGLAEIPIPAIYPDIEGRWLSSFPADLNVDRAGSWRLTAFVPGLPAPKNPAGAKEAAKLLGFFHRHLNLPEPLNLKPLPEGEFTNQHLSTVCELEQILIDYRGHPRLGDLMELIERAICAAKKFSPHPGLEAVFASREALIHGDPKADNFLFSPDGRALSLLDWDSVGLGHALIDVAELLRSWGACGGAGQLEFANLASGLEGYAETGLELSLEDVEMLPAALRGITLNLARRYLIDALAQTYFRWDKIFYPSLFDQNKARAQNMLAVGEKLIDLEIPLGRVLIASYRRGKKAIS